MEQKAPQQTRISDQDEVAEHHEVDRFHTSQKTVEELDGENLERVVGGINPAVKDQLANGIKTRSVSEILGQKSLLWEKYGNSQLPPKKRREIPDQNSLLWERHDNNELPPRKKLR